MILMTEIYGYRMKKRSDCMIDDKIDSFIDKIIEYDFFMKHSRKLCILK